MFVSIIDLQMARAIADTLVSSVETDLIPICKASQGFTSGEAATGKYEIRRSL